MAKELNLKIIPIGSTGYESARIWEEVKEYIIDYPYLEKYIDSLKTETNPSKIVKIVHEILSSLLE